MLLGFKGNIIETIWCRGIILLENLTRKNSTRIKRGNIIKKNFTIKNRGKFVQTEAKEKN